jgi:DNA mismatch endonuclease, patch repair protein
MEEETLTDIVDKPTRSRMMSRITGRDTRPELIIRKALHRRGFRFRLHMKGLPGKPDLILPAYRTAIFVNGCFWHCHECSYFRLPKSNQEFWRAKLGANVLRDVKNTQKLLDGNWYVATIWECVIRDQSIEFVEEKIEMLCNWLTRKKYRRQCKIVSA